MIYIWQPNLDGCRRIAKGDNVTLRFTIPPITGDGAAMVEVKPDGSVRGLNPAGREVAKQDKKNDESG